MQHTPFTHSDTTCRAGDGEHELWIHVSHSHPTRIVRESSPKLCNLEHSTELRLQSDCLFRAILVNSSADSSRGVRIFFAPRSRRREGREWGGARQRRVLPGRASGRRVRQGLSGPGDRGCTENLRRRFLPSASCIRRSRKRDCGRNCSPRGLVETSGEADGRNLLCACGRVMKKQYSSPVFQYLDFLRFPEPAAALRESTKD
jgi:hypothetical protein